VVSGELEKSLREKIDGYLNSRLNEIHEEIARLQSQLNETFTRLLEYTTDEARTDQSLSHFIAEHIHAAHERGIEEAKAASERAKASSEMAILKAAIEDIDDQRSQVNILNKLVNGAASFAPRVAFFVIRNEQALGWRARGLEGTVGDDAIRDVSLSLASDTILSDVVNSRATWSGQPGSKADDHLLLDKLGSEPPERMVAVPLVVRGKTVAVLYADSAGLDADAINLEVLETLTRVAGMAVELLAVSRVAPAEQHPERRVQPEVAAAQPAHEVEHRPQPVTETASPSKTVIAETAEVEAEPAVEEKGFAEYVEPAPQYEEQPTAQPETTYAQPVFEQPLETTYAQPTEAAPSRAEFAPPAETFSSGSYSAPLGRSRYGSTEELPVEVSEEEKRLHNDARRFARLLVSEIKLYNEEKVREGRSEGNIYERLREDIDRSRQMYDKRVAPPVAARYDYFHQELVNTLAEGDPSKLGDSYPGAAASA
jgi:hypothetical protein